MIGPGKQILSIEATVDLMQEIERRNDPENRSKIRLQELPRAD